MCRTTPILLTLALVPTALVGQQPPATATDAVRLRTFAGAGSGPAGSMTVGVEAVIPAGSGLAIRAEYSHWFPGFGAACLLIWPDAYACHVNGGALLGGLRLSARERRVTPYGQVSAGVFGRDRFAGFSTPAAGAGAGADVRVGARWSLGIGARILRVLDGDYEVLMGEDLQYIVGTFALEYATGW